MSFSIPSSSRPSRDMEDTLTFDGDLRPVKDWYNRQSRNGSTTIRRMELRNEYAMPFHQFIVIKTQGEPGCAFRVDRGREREGWSVPDTVKELGVPPRDTIAVLQKPAEEINKMSHCTMELHCSDDRTIDLSFVLGICFRIHNNWGTRYNLITHNCYFFARTVINVCSDKLNKESNSVWRYISTTAYRWSALLIYLSVCILAATLQSTRLPDVIGLVLECFIGFLLVPIMPLAILQIVVALAVRDIVSQAVKWELELELEQGGVPDLEMEEREWTRALDIVLGRINIQEQQQVQKRVWVRALVTVFEVLMLLAPLALIIVPSPPLNRILIAFLWGHIYASIGACLWLLHRWPELRRTTCTRQGSALPFYTDAEMGGVVCVNGIELVATGRLAHGGNGWAASATQTGRAQVVGMATAYRSGEQQIQRGAESAQEMDPI